MVGSGAWLGSGGLLLLGVALVVGLVMAVAVNKNALHAVLGKLRLTKEDSFPSEWYSSFDQILEADDEVWITLHLYDTRRLYGLLIEWPSSPDVGHFRNSRGQWLHADNKNKTDAARYILIRVQEVEIVEFN